MFSNYYTRDGQLATINSISEYVSYGLVTLYAGNVGDEEVTWDQNGRYKMNQLFGDKLPHKLDLVSWEE